MSGNLNWETEGRTAKHRTSTQDDRYRKRVAKQSFTYIFAKHYSTY